MSFASACNVYNATILKFTDHSGQKDSGAAEKDAAVTPKTDAGGQADAAVCVPTAEICNKIDDDCNGIVDDPATVQAYCEQRVKHAASACQRGVCVKIGECGPGYYNCDGDPSNGCEPICTCQVCEDAGSGDSGADAN